MDEARSGHSAFPTLPPSTEPALVTVPKLLEVATISAPGDVVLQGGVKGGLAGECHSGAFLLDCVLGPLCDLSGI